MKTIIIKRDYAAKCFTASFYEHGTADLRIMSLFGSHVLPTAFDTNAKPDRVVAAIARKNPGTDVFLG